MIVSKTPLRIGLFSGGSDLPAFYKQDVGMSLSCTIDKFNYVCVNFPTDNKIRWTHDKVDVVDDVKDVRHKIIKECLEYMNIRNGISVHSISDINGKGSGLGSSSAFTVGLLNCLSYAKYNKNFHKEILAKSACDVEINKCGFPIGKQDQYAAAYGGFNRFLFWYDELVQRDSVINQEILNKFQKNLILVYTGIERDSSDILSKQSVAMFDKNKFELVKKRRDRVNQAIQLLYHEKYDDIGRLFHEDWLDKKQVTDNITSNPIDVIYETGLELGALGGKILGAGGGGHMLFYVPLDKQAKFRYEIERLQVYNMMKSVTSYSYNDPIVPVHCIEKISPKVIDFKFTYEGSKVVEI